MDNVKETDEYKELESKFAEQEKKFQEQQNYINTLKKSVDDIKADRETLKSKVKGLEEKKTTESASAEQLKEILAEQKKKTEEIERKASFLEKKNALAELARAKNFVTTTDGKLDFKTLTSQFDLDNFELSSDGGLIGGEEFMTSLKEKSPHLFVNPKKAVESKDTTVRKFKGVDVSSEAFSKATTQQRIAIVKARGELSKDETNNVLPGMGNPSLTAQSPS